MQDIFKGTGGTEKGVSVRRRRSLAEAEQLVRSVISPRSDALSITHMLRSHKEASLDVDEA